MVCVVIVLALMANGFANANPAGPVDRSDRAIVTIRVDQKGSSYIIHPELSRLEAEALLAAGRLSGNRTGSFFYNVTGLTAAAAEELALAARSTGAYQTPSSTSPASRLFLEALLQEINADQPLDSEDDKEEEPEEEEVEEADEGGEDDSEFVVHGGDPISVSYDFKCCNIM